MNTNQQENKRESQCDGPKLFPHLYFDMSHSKIVYSTFILSEPSSMIIRKHHLGPNPRE